MLTAEQDNLWWLYCRVFKAQHITGVTRRTRHEIAAEMRAVIEAPDVETASKVIGWWGWDDEKELRSAVRRIRRAWERRRKAARRARAGEEG